MCMEELAADYESGALHPVDVKQALVKAINMMLQVNFFICLLTCSVFYSMYVLSFL